MFQLQNNPQVTNFIMGVLVGAGILWYYYTFFGAGTSFIFYGFHVSHLFTGGLFVIIGGLQPGEFKNVFSNHPRAAAIILGMGTIFLLDDFINYYIYGQAFCVFNC